MDVLKNVKTKWHLYRSVFLIFYEICAMLQVRVGTILALGSTFLLSNIDSSLLFFPFIEYRSPRLTYRCRKCYHL